MDPTPVDAGVDAAGGMGGGSIGTGGQGAQGGGGQGSGGQGGAAPELVAAKMAAGDAHGCAIGPQGTLRCWGSNEFGQLGQGNTSHLGDEPGELPPADVPLGEPVLEVALGGAHTCVRLEGGSVRCFGYNEFGQLGQGNTSHIGDEPGELPPPVVDVGGTVMQLVAGGRHTCALLSTGGVRCWGDNDYGQLGQGHTSPIGDEPGEMPPPEVPLGGAATYLFAGYDHTCARMETGALRCWGKNESGQLGLGSTNSVGDEPGEMPPPDVLLGGTIAMGGAGDEHTCALLTSGAVRCWGTNKRFQLGHPDVDGIGDAPGEMPPPDVAIGEGTPTGIGSGHRFNCVRTAEGSLRCWGHNSAGQCGSGATTYVGDMPGELPPPDVAVGGASPVSEVAAGYSHVCVRLESAAIRCWGKGQNGALGSGSTDDVGDDESPASMADVTVF
ncbi:RCC1 domain-containing protein [Polyangium mundeleinium]|uniref:RCC1-like domain-containing protein n=1 Tax=Polyangium mundeleinium TaxID=2995306 RepID=A0ABT5EZ36_9BACT|nr:hypothetical protein [Polyangium mundeleinium]MDC0746157.1 hypothetical protein [Polyangium mundeleinium]